jgi:glycosyltransferase involved in cell wall biosynthesis
MSSPARPPDDPHCLVVTKLVPLPADTGGKLRTLAFLRRLVRDHPVTVVALAEDGADCRGLAELGIDVRARPWRRGPGQLVGGVARTGSLSSARFWDATLAAEVRDVARAHPSGRLIVEYAQLEPWVRRAPAGRRVLATHNIESRLVHNVAATTTGPRRVALHAEAEALARLERRLLRHADVVSVVSERDRARLGVARPGVVVCPNGVDVTAAAPWHGRPEVVFVGHLGWAPNVDAATWFTNHVWPAVAAAEPHARLRLVGRTPAPAVLSLAGARIEVTGTVPDTQPYLRDATVAVAPLRAGSGTRLKILEALGAGRPVVATSIGAEGLEDLAGHGLVIVDDPAEMAATIVGLLRDPDRARRLGELGHARISAAYAWDATLTPLLEACE